MQEVRVRSQVRELRVEFALKPTNQNIKQEQYCYKFSKCFKNGKKKKKTDQKFLRDIRFWKIFFKSFFFWKKKECIDFQMETDIEQEAGEEVILSEPAAHFLKLGGEGPSR